MMNGAPPFYSEKQNEVYQKILKKDVIFYSSIPITEEGKDIIRKLLN
jgi:hypothetical protein